MLKNILKTVSLLFLALANAKIENIKVMREVDLMETGSNLVIFQSEINFINND